MQIVGAGLHFKYLNIAMLICVCLLMLPLMLALSSLTYIKGKFGIFSILHGEVSIKVAILITTIFWLSLQIVLACCTFILGHFLAIFLGISNPTIFFILAVMYYLIATSFNWFNIIIPYWLIIIASFLAIILPLLLLALAFIVIPEHTINYQVKNNLITHYFPNYLIQVSSLYLGIEVILFYFRTSQVKIKHKSYIFLVSIILVSILYILSARFINSLETYGHYLNTTDTHAIKFFQGIKYALHIMQLDNYYRPFLLIVILFLAIMFMPIITASSRILKVAINRTNPFNYLSTTNRFNSPIIIIALEATITILVLLVVLWRYNQQRILLDLLNPACAGIMIYFLTILIIAFRTEYSRKFSVYCAIFGAGILFATFNIINIFIKVPSNSIYYLPTVSATITIILLLSMLITKIITP
jgi:hypothetical protein